MRNQPETLHEYNIPRLHWWFLLSSFVFVVSLVLMVWVDYSGGEIRWLGLRGDRTWKNYQREFYGLERQRLAADAKAAELRANEQGLGKIKTELEQVEKQLAGEKGRRSEGSGGCRRSSRDGRKRHAGVHDAEGRARPVSLGV